MKAWLKGGLIGGAYSIYALIMKLVILGGIIPKQTLNELPHFINLVIAGTLLPLTLSSVPFAGQYVDKIDLITGAIIIIVIGTLIGWIIGKIKSKKQESFSSAVPPKT